MSNQTSKNYLSHVIWENMEWVPSEHQIEQFFHFQKILKELNKSVNLTRLTDGKDFWISQVFDSLWPLKNELNNPHSHKKVIDVGTGCGFPGLAIAIALPNASVTLVDSVRRKTDAVKKISIALGLEARVFIRNERIELTGHNRSFRACFDLAVARAVAKTSVLAEYLFPLLNSEGEALIYKGKWNKFDQEQLERSLVPLNARIKRIENINLPEELGIRHSIRLSKMSICPAKYPRSIGIPVKRPLSN